MDWQPIEDAPKMQDVIIARRECPSHKPLIAWQGDGSGERYPKGWNSADGGVIRFVPTHWMPTPEL